jgi:hypothetical protein
MEKEQVDIPNQKDLGLVHDRYTEPVSDEEIEEEFIDVLDNLTDDEFWKYTRSWLSVEHIIDIMKNWDTGIKKAIQEMRDIQNDTKGKKN